MLRFDNVAWDKGKIVYMLRSLPCPGYSIWNPCGIHGIHAESMESMRNPWNPCGIHGIHQEFHVESME